MSHVFISYKSEERKKAQSVRMALRAELGCDIWWDQDLQTGGQWSQDLDSALQSADCVVVLWSKRSVQSQWVQQEAAVAKALGILAPAQIDECLIPSPYASIQAARLISWRGSEKDGEFGKLTARVRACLESRAAARPLPTNQSSGAFPAWRSVQRESRGIGLIGADGTGKTTLVNGLRQRYTSDRLRYISEVSRNVIQKGYPLGKNANTESYIVLMRDQISELMNMVRNGTTFVSDRTLLDQLCYARVNATLPRPAVTRNLIEMMEYVWFLEREYYRTYFYFPVEFPIENDGVRVIDPDYQTKIDHEFRRLINNYNIPYHEIRGTGEERLRKAQEVIDTNFFIS